MIAYHALFVLLVLVTSCAQSLSSEETVIEQCCFEELSLPLGVHPAQVSYDETEGRLSFLESVDFSAMNNSDEDIEGFYWVVPRFVREIVIDRGVIVSGGFRVQDTITIKGMDRESSVIYGTMTKAWALGPDRESDPKSSCSNGPSGDDILDDCEKWRYGAISTISGRSDPFPVRIQSITIENARTYAITSFKQPIYVDDVHIVNTRPIPDWHSNSDGISAGPHSVIRNSKIDTWDDAIKLYRDMTVENVTIIHRSNGAPLQLGWGDGVPFSEHRIDNLLVLHKPKMGHNNLAYISASIKNGSYDRTIHLGGVRAQYADDAEYRDSSPLPLILSKSDNVNINIKSLESPYEVLLTAPKLVSESGNILLSLCGTYDYETNELSCNGKTVTGCGW